MVLKGFDRSLTSPSASLAQTVLWVFHQKCPKRISFCIYQGKIGSHSQYKEAFNIQNMPSDYDDNDDELTGW